MIKLLQLMFILIIASIFHLQMAKAQFSSATVKQIDTIKNNTEVDITLDPVSSVKVNSLTGGFALQSGASKELEESAVTSTELGFVSGVTSSIQTQIDGKQDALPLSVNGDILFYNSGFQSLAIGTANQVLTVTGGLPVWADPQGSSPTTTLGDLIYNDGGGAASDVRLAIGTNDQVLTVVSGEPAWADNPANPTTTKGDIFVNDGTSAARLPVGTDNFSLVADSTQSEGLSYVQMNKECQTKTTTANFTTNGTVTQLTMNNISPGDIFSVNLEGAFQVGAGDATATVSVFDGATTVTSSAGGNGSGSNISFRAHSINNCYVATGTSFTVVTSSFGASSFFRSGSKLQICRLPVNTICNSTTWN